MSSNIHYVKPFSGGQITIPKKFRDKLGVDKDTWLKIELKNSSLSIEPQQKPQSFDKAAYIKKLLSLETDWFDYDDWKKMRAELEQRAKKYDY